MRLKIKWIWNFAFSYFGARNKISWLKKDKVSIHNSALYHFINVILYPCYIWMLSPKASWRDRASQWLILHSHFIIVSKFQVIKLLSKCVEHLHSKVITYVLWSFKYCIIYNDNYKSYRHPRNLLNTCSFTRQACKVLIEKYVPTMLD